jgi:hypothetical protein
MGSPQFITERISGDDKDKEGTCAQLRVLPQIQGDQEVERYPFPLGIEHFKFSNQTCAEIRGRLPGIASLLK